MRKTAAIGLVVAFFATLLGAGTASASGTLTALACQSNSNGSARLERLTCSSNFIGRVRVTVTRPIGMVGHWEFTENGNHIRNEPFNSDVWLGPNAPRETTVERWAPRGAQFCAVLWESTGTQWVSRGRPCVTI